MSIRTGKWRVQGFNGADPILEFELKAREYTENSIHEILRILAATGLTPQEAASALTDPAGGRLGVKRDRGTDRVVYMSGENPHFVARHMPID